MARNLFGLVAAAAFAMAGGAGMGESAGDARQPVLVELFTSEGCSSCPPADTLLGKLDSNQPVEGAQIIVLEEHVDYWNHDGWRDPYSSSAFTARQQDYGRKLGGQEAYTPQMVVDGSVEFNGSDARKAVAAIGQAAGGAKLGIRIRPAESGGGAVSIEVDQMPEGKAHKANVYLTYATDRGTSDVLRGENQGKTLHHVAIAGEIQQIGSVSTKAGFSRRVALRTNKSTGSQRLVSFVQDSGSGHILGAAMYAIPQGDK
jgi:hypothetical protein